MTTATSPRLTLDTLSPTRRVRAVALGRWLQRWETETVSFGLVLSRYGVNGRGGRIAGAPTRAEMIQAINGLAGAGGVRLLPSPRCGDFDMELLPALGELIGGDT